MDFYFDNSILKKSAIEVHIVDSDIIQLYAYIG